MYTTYRKWSVTVKLVRDSFQTRRHYSYIVGRSSVPIPYDLITLYIFILGAVQHVIWFLVYANP